MSGRGILGESQPQLYHIDPRLAGSRPGAHGGADGSGLLWLRSLVRRAARRILLALGCRNRPSLPESPPLPPAAADVTSLNSNS